MRIHKFLTSTVSALLLLTSCVLEKVETTPTFTPISTTSEFSENKYSEHFDISIGYWNLDKLSNKKNSDELIQYVEKLFNITIQPVSVTWSNYKENYKILSATDSLPDIFTTLTLSSNDDNDSAFLNDMIKNGSIRALPKDLSKFENVEKLMNSVSYTRYDDGNFYAIPRTSFNDSTLSTTDAVMLVRRDWMNNLGFENPITFDEFLNMTEAFTKNDPDGNGIDDTYGYNVSTISALGKWVILGIAPECNVYSWTLENGNYIPSWATEDFKKVTVAFRKLYECGALDPDFYTKNNSEVLHDFATNKLGTLEYKGSPATIMELKTIWDANNEKPFEECVDFLPIFPSEDGKRYSNSSCSFWSETLISSSVSDEKLDRILALYEYLLSDEGMKLSKFGIPDVDYKEINSDFELLIETENKGLNRTLTDKYPSFYLFSSLATWGGTFEDFEETKINYIRYGEIPVKLGRKILLWNLENTIQVERPYEFLMYPKDATELFSTERAFTEFINCIIGTEDVNIMWDSYINSLNQQGFAEYISNQNSNFKNK